MSRFASAYLVLIPPMLTAGIIPTCSGDNAKSHASPFASSTSHQHLTHTNPHTHNTKPRRPPKFHTIEPEIAHASNPFPHSLPHNVNLPLLPRPPPHLHSPQTHLPPPAPQQHSNRPHRPHCPTRPAHRRTPYHHRARRCAAPAFQDQQHGQRRHAGRGVCGV